MTQGPSARATREFLAEAGEIIDGMRRSLAVIDATRREGRPLPSSINEMFRGAHSLKGLAGMFSVDALASLAHELESLLDALRLGRRSVDDALVARAHVALDACAASLDALARGGDLDRARVATVVAALRDLVEDAPLSVEVPSTELTLDRDALAVLTEYEEHRLDDNLKNGVPIWRVRAPLSFDTFEAALSALSASIHAHGELITTLPSTSDDHDGITFDLVCASSVAEDVLKRALAALSPDYALERVDRSKAASTVTAPAVPQELLVDDEESPRAAPETVRVDIGKLDDLMGMVGELVLAREALARVSDALKVEHGYRGLIVDLHRAVRSMTRRIDEIQAAVMQVRMIPLAHVFERLRWTAERAARELAREVTLEFSGEDTELDKLVVEEIVDPLMHLVRNAVDHGLEPPDERERAGKARAGRISVAAFPRGSHVVIELRDDGRGFDEVAIKRTALERGLVSEDRVGSLTRREVWDLLFLPGFTTRRQVTGTSGRGVGLDVVKHNIARLSGFIDIESAAGEGTRFTITMPITLAIIRALVVRVRDASFCLPLSSVLEVVVLRAADVCLVDGREMAVVRGETLPLIRLERVFALTPAAARQARSSDEREGIGYVALVALLQHRVALFIDDVTGQQDIVVKPLGALLARVRGFSGATQLGEEETVLVLDVAAIVQDHLERFEARESGGEAQPTQ